jgi:flagellar biosynthesis/type III secretory pathway M-ring protein FliF/YscJ
MKTVKKINVNIAMPYSSLFFLKKKEKSLLEELL